MSNRSPGNMGMLRSLFTIPVILILALPANPAAADGKFFPRYEAARDPSIPAQRAIIRFIDGVQTMLVESDVNETGDEVGWILPLPAEPTSIEAATPGTIRTLQMLVQPKIIVAGEVGGLALCLLFPLLLVMLWCILHVRNQQMHVALWVLLILITLTGCFFAAIPSLGKTRGAPPPEGLDVLRNERIGTYDVAVIRATEADVIRTWLDDNDFDCPGDAVPVLEEYIDDEWVFCVARLARSAAHDQTLSHHPLHVEFASDRCVYPMRLTGVTDQPLLLDLFIIADRAAEARGLSTWFVGAMAQRKVWSNLIDDDVDAYADESGSFTIGHAGVINLMYDGCTLTHLRGTLSPRQMREDIEITFTDRAAYRRTVFSPPGARNVVALPSIVVLLFLWPILAVRARDHGWQPRRFLARAGGLSIAITAIGFILALGLLPERNVRMDAGSLAVVSTAHRVDRALQSQHAAVDLTELLMLIEQESDYLHRITGTSSDDWHIDIPGGYVIEETESGWRVSVFDVLGHASVHEITRAVSE